MMRRLLAGRAEEEERLDLSTCCKREGEECPGRRRVFPRTSLQSSSGRGALEQGLHGSFVAATMVAAGWGKTRGRARVWPGARLNRRSGGGQAPGSRGGEPLAAQRRRCGGKGLPWPTSVRLKTVRERRQTCGPGCFRNFLELQRSL